MTSSNIELTIPDTLWLILDEHSRRNGGSGNVDDYILMVLERTFASQIEEATACAAKCPPVTAAVFATLRAALDGPGHHPNPQYLAEYRQGWTDAVNDMEAVESTDGQQIAATGYRIADGLRRAAYPRAALGWHRTGYSNAVEYFYGIVTPNWENGGPA